MSVNSISAITELAKLVKSHAPDLTFSILEIGARPVVEQPEPYTALLDVFENTKISAFEVDESLCKELNAKSHRNVEYYPCALSKKTGKQTLFETQHPMCSSLYESNDELMKKYFRLEMAMSKEQHEIEVMALDDFIKSNAIETIDFVKIDIQGAELDVFQGGESALKDSLFIVSEVEFIPLYKSQPLFGDVSSYLQGKGFMFHKFIDLSGRCLKPVAIQNNPNFVSQAMWADAVFIKDLATFEQLDNQSLLKTALFAFMYGSPDLTFYCFNILDQRNQTTLCQELSQLGR